MTGAIVRFFQGLPAWATSPTLGFGVVLLMGLTDTLTGPYMWWTFVYVLPVTFFSWCNSRTTSLGLAILSGLVSLYANQTWHVPERPEWVGYWNGAVTGIICVFIALTVSALRDAIRQRDLARLLSDLVTFYGATASRKQIALTAAGLESPVFVRADRERIAEVLDDPIGNALKFTPTGGSLDLALVLNGENVEIRLQDSGPGIPPSQREHVFEPHWKGDTDQAGAGLGLCISRAIVEQHGGRIWFEGAAQGTVTHVRLPLSGSGSR